VFVNGLAAIGYKGVTTDFIGCFAALCPATGNTSVAEWISRLDNVTVQMAGMARHWFAGEFVCSSLIFNRTSLHAIA
jgi:hypothetical protein